MYIANPIYDVIFKYMMEDLNVATQFISTIIDEKVVKLDFAPQEYTVEVKDNLTVCRYDFLAKIETTTEHRTVLIEIQKAKFPTDIMRFRRYLGVQYQNEGNYYMENGQQKAIQIYCIFVLGESLGIKGVPVIEINHTAKDNATNIELKDLKNEFIDSLHHRSWIVQVTELPKHHRNTLERLLGIFDQSKRISTDRRILNVTEEDFLELFQPVIRRLQKASENEEMRLKMIAEDEIMEIFKSEERTKQKLVEAKQELVEKDKKLAEKDKKLAETKQALTEKDSIILQQQKEIEELKRKNENK